MFLCRNRRAVYLSPANSGLFCHLSPTSFKSSVSWHGAYQQPEGEARCSAPLLRALPGHQQRSNAENSGHLQGSAEQARRVRLLLIAPITLAVGANAAGVKL